MICTSHRGSSPSCARLSCHPRMQRALLFDFELSIPSNFLFFSFSFNLLQSLLHFFHNLEGSNNTAYFAKKEMESCDESYLHTFSLSPSSSLLRPSSLSTTPMTWQWWRINDTMTTSGALALMVPDNFPAATTSPLDPVAQLRCGEP